MSIGTRVVIAFFSIFIGNFVHAQSEYERMVGKTNKLIEEQKFQAAVDLLNENYENLKEPFDQARALTKILQLETGLHEYETAVKNFRARKWPQDIRSQALLNIFYASSLKQYVQSYGYEIRKRTKIIGKGPQDLRSMTTEEIYQEAMSSLLRLWKKRQELAQFAKADLPDFVIPNTFPKGVRDTLRDSYTYLFVGLLNDSSGWSAQQLNEIYRLNLSQLLQGNFAQSFDLQSEVHHPLEKISFILHDLKNWNKSSVKLEAMLDSQVSLSQILHERMTHEKDREIIRENLAKILEKSTHIPWYTVGAGELAQFWQSSSDRKALEKAKAIAQQALALFPKSFGAALCRDIIKAIEEPQLEMQGMRIDGPARRSVGLDYKNVKKVYFRSYKYDFKAKMIGAQDYDYFPNNRDLDNIFARTRPNHEWTAELPETTDFKIHKAYLVPPRHDKGHYIVIASMKGDFKAESNILKSIVMTVSDLVISTRNVLDVTELEVRDGNTGALKKNLKLEVYKKEYGKKGTFLVTELKTNEEGKATFKVAGVQGGAHKANGTYVAFASEGTDQSYIEFHKWQESSSASQRAQSLIYTDRAIYRPLQKIQWKAIFFAAEAEVGKFKAIKQVQQKVTLIDMNGQEVARQNVTTDEFGSAWGEFQIPAGRALGQWSISSESGRQFFRVEEYKRPTFELKWKEQLVPIRLNQRAEITGEATYYFGSPVAKGKVQYTVQRRPVLPWWCFWGYFNFHSYEQPQILENSVTSLSDDGSFKIRFMPEGDKRLADSLEDLQYHYEILVDVVDEGGETRSLTKSIIIGNTSVKAEIKFASPMVLEEQILQAEILRTTLQGSTAPGSGEWQLHLLKEPEEAPMPAEQPMPSYLTKFSQQALQFADDKKLARWNAQYNWQAIVKDWPTSQMIAQGKSETNEQGISKVSLPKLKAGAYRLIYKSKDSFAASLQAQQDFFVVNSTYRPQLPGLFLISKPQAKVGELIHIWMPTALKNQTYIFEVAQDRKVIERKIFDSSNTSALLSWKVKESDRGGLAFSIRLLHDYQELALTQNLFVPWDNKEIKMEFTSFREKISPGSEETWTVKLKGENKEKLKKASVQLLALMYDRSLDQLAAFNSPSLFTIYPSRFSMQLPAVGLGLARQAYVNYSYYTSREYLPPSEDRPHYFDNYAIGGPGNRRGMTLGRGQIREESFALPKSAGLLPQRSKEEAKLNSASAIKDTANEGVSNNVNSLRSQFAETAFFLPNIRNSANGDFEIKFTVPDSVTSWSIRLHAQTQELMAGSLTQTTQSTKDLLVRPYLPRFLREGDKADLRFILNNTSDKPISGSLNIDLLDADKKTNIAKKFKVADAFSKDIKFSIAPLKSFTHVMPLTVPTGLGSLYIQAMARAGAISDGELRLLPILPGRFHLAESKFVTLKNSAKKQLEFKSLSQTATGSNPETFDPTRINERLVVQIDGQLFYSVLQALPYLVDYPFECTEQTLNRFISTGIMSSLYKKYPAIEKMAKTLSSRKTRYESFDNQDANRRMALEETPWLNQAKGGAESAANLQNILDSRINQQNLQESLKKLEKSQTALGGFPWFPGGPPSPYVTLYVLYGFSKALEFGVQVPQEMLKKSWDYLHRHYLNAIVDDCMGKGGCWEFVTFLNYVISNYPQGNWGQSQFTDNERATMLDFSFKHWKLHSPYLKGFLTLTLHRAKRQQDAKLVWDSVMDSAKGSEEEGTHWAAEDRSWLWYNDTIESHAFALRTLLEIEAKNEKIDGLVQWLFLNKKLNHWKSTRATAEVIYSLAHYLNNNQLLGKAESVVVKVGQEKQVNFEFLPEQYTGGKNQLTYEAEKVSPKLMPIAIEKSTPGFMFASANWQYSTEKMPQQAVGDFIHITRNYFVRDKANKQSVLRPIAEGNKIQVGDEIEVQISLKLKHQMEYVHLRDPRGAGFEPVGAQSRHKWDLGIHWYEEIRDSGTNFFFEQLPKGEYTFKYRLRAATAGEFKVNPATAQPMYAPEFAAFSTGVKLKVE